MNRDQLRLYDEEDQIISSLSEIEYIEKNFKEVTPYKCGLPTIDEAINGFVPGEFIILSGRPKHGKSLTMRTFINNFFIHGLLSCVFSYEEQPRYFYQNFPNGGRDITFYVPKKLRAFDLDWIIERAIEAKLKYDTRMVFIDHGHYLFNVAEKNSTGAASDVGRRLKRLAVDEGLIIFLIWHIMKVNIASVTELDQALIRDSGLMCGEADDLLFTYRQVTSTGLISTSESYITVDFSRRTGAMKLLVPIVKDGAFFREIM
jgi:predicted ATP-dependent serine protease